MKVLLDHCVPRPLSRHLHGFDVVTARAMGWDELENGELVAQAETHFDVMITADQNLRYQQNLTNRRLAIVVLPSNYTPVVLALAGKIVAALGAVKPGGWVEIEP